MKDCCLWLDRHDSYLQSKVLPEDIAQGLSPCSSCEAFIVKRHICGATVPVLGSGCPAVVLSVIGHPCQTLKHLTRPNNCPKICKKLRCLLWVFSCDYCRHGRETLGPSQDISDGLLAWPRGC